MNTKRAQHAVRIAVATSQPIIGIGLTTLLRRIFDTQVNVIDISSPEDFLARVATFSPEIIIVSPTFFPLQDVSTYCEQNKIDLEGVAVVALLTTLLPSELLLRYDTQISIFDDERTIKTTIVALSGEQPIVGGDDPEPTQLSLREKQIVKGVAGGLTNKEIAEQMKISVFTVLTHRRNIARKLNIHTPTAISIYAMANGIVTVKEVNKRSGATG